MKIGDTLRVKTKYESVIGKIVDISNNYIELMINPNEYKTYLRVSIIESEIV